jgi:exodeoxyribonuclease V alpha subunit
MQTIDVHKVFAEYFKGSEALAYALSAKLGEGNICLDIAKYKDELPQILEEQKSKLNFVASDSIYWVTPETFQEQCREDNYVTHSLAVLKPFVIQNGKAYLHRYFQYETQIIENIKRLGGNFHIITGGPGTGKTYSVSTKLVELFRENTDLKVALAAPTGKAAARMNESIKKFAENPVNKIEDAIKVKLTGLKASTLHRLLGNQKDSVFFRHNRNNPLPYDLVIIDECSMIDGAMMAKVLNAISDTTILYLLGDKDQLASIEAGSVFGDICRAGNSVLLKNKVEIKEKSLRFDLKKGIGKFSRQLIEGSFVGINDYYGDEQLTIDTEYNDALFMKSALHYMPFILETDIKQALIKLNLVRFLCVTKQNRHSVSETNKRIEKILATAIGNKELFYPKEGFYHNQPVIVTQNNYELGVFNGDVGIIRKDLVKGIESLYAYFENNEGEIVKIPATYLTNSETVFAMTIHKSQGSEFQNVVVILPENSTNKLLTRELLYTAVTRAKSTVLLQTSEEVLKRCADEEVTRASGLENRLNAENL